MNPLTPPDSHHLSAGQGWLELGNHLEAREELRNLNPVLHSHPDVLELQWGICFAEKNWNACFDVGSALVQSAPKRAHGWRHRSVSLHQMKRSREAYDLLFPALEMFPKDWTIHYDMACYACVLRNLEEAWARLEKAFELGKLINYRRFRSLALAEAQSIKQMALGDPDLESLWSKIGEVGSK